MSETEANAELEQEAREVGWRPQEEFKGDPDKWLPAKDYLQKAETMLPILRGNLKTLKKELKDRDQKHIAELAAIKGTLGEVREFYSKAEERAYERAVKDVRAQMKQAVAEGDTEAYNAAEAQLDELTKPGATKAPDSKGNNAKPVPGWENPQETLAAWRTENEWYLKDPWLGKEADQLANYLAMNKIYPTMNDMLQEVTKLMKERYPEQFGGRRKEPDSVVGAGESYAGGGKKKGKHTPADLPAEDRATFERWKKTIPGYTWEEFAEAYDWGE